MKKSFVCFIALLFLTMPLSQGEVLAGGSDSTGYTITNTDTPQPYDLGGGDIITTGNTNGVSIYNSGQAIKNGGSITTGAHGVSITGAGTSIDLTGVDITTTGNSSNGVRAMSNATVVMSGGSIQSSSSSGSDYSVYVTGNANVTMNDVDVKNMDWNSSHAYYIQSSVVTINGGSINTRDSTGNNSKYALYMRGSNSTLTLKGVNIKAESGSCLDVSEGNPLNNNIYIYDSVMTSTGGNGIYVSNNYLEMKNSSIETTGDSATTFLFNGSAASANLENVSILHHSAGNYGISNAMNVQLGAQVTIKSADISTTGSNTLAIMTHGSTGQEATITGLESVYNIKGGIYANTYATIDFTMADSSVFNGWARYANSTNSVMNLTLKGANTRWNLRGDGLANPTGDSYITNLTLDGATVDYTNAEWGAFILAQNLNPGAGSSGGTFILKTDILSQDRTDQLRVTRTSEGNHTISVTGDAGAATDGTEELILVQTADQAGSFSLATGTVDYGAWRYSLTQDTTSGAPYGWGALWLLSATGAATNPASNAVNTFSGAYLLAYAETQTLTQRLGDLRQTPYLNGLWFRVHGGKFESNSRSFVQGFDMTYGGVQIGYDRPLETNLPGQLYVGGMFGYSRGDLDYLDTGDGTVDSKTVGVYGTYIGRDGFYVDAVLKYQWMNNDFNALDYALDRVTGSDVATGGLGASLEVGKRIHVEQDKKSSKTGWYVEPQAQLIYQHQGSGSFTASNGLNIGVDSFTSLIGRVGTLVGYETGKTNIYAKVSYVKEFDGDVNVIANDVAVPMSFGDNWWVYGIGFTTIVNERNSVYASVERASGGTFTQPWRAEAGWRIVF